MRGYVQIDNNLKEAKTTIEIGSRAEQLAVDYLLERGFTIRHRNWRNGRYELDVVAQMGDTLHFVEVKCRRFGALTSPADAITDAKFRSLCRAAELYIEQFEIELEIQFDLVAVEYDDRRSEIEYTPNAMIQRW